MRVFRIRYNSGYAWAMKIAVSMPDELFQKAELTAQRLKMSRSQLYATALAQFLAHSDSQSVTDRLTEVYSTEPSKLDPVLHRMQRASLEPEKS